MDIDPYYWRHKAAQVAYPGFQQDADIRGASPEMAYDVKMT